MEGGQFVVARFGSKRERTEFDKAWQMRVKRMLIDHFDDPALIDCRVESVPAPA